MNARIQGGVRYARRCEGHELREQTGCRGSIAGDVDLIGSRGNRVRRHSDPLSHDIKRPDLRIDAPRRGARLRSDDKSGETAWCCGHDRYGLTAG